MHAHRVAAAAAASTTQAQPKPGEWPQLALAPSVRPRPPAHRQAKQSVRFIGRSSSIDSSNDAMTGGQARALKWWPDSLLAGRPAGRLANFTLLLPDEAAGDRRTDASKQRDARSPDTGRLSVSFPPVYPSVRPSVSGRPAGRPWHRRLRPPLPLPNRPLDRKKNHCSGKHETKRRRTARVFTWVPSKPPSQPSIQQV